MLRFGVTPSRPTRARGLKLVLIAMISTANCVAPHAGAWIETKEIIMDETKEVSRAPRGRVD